ncbi:calcium-binding protein [Rhizobium leguminosarum bv. viciae]|uniref:Calcium-binding protein n=1 Tax=Rhizobium leguminosarum bv. viciae TaxID=387 RepID=A0A8I2GVS4_RHILV|nr:calcium-binding protein [Rhizobium leguminosarum]NKM49249.1 calcium-binding protein [Rhizobium leguminosarum bv. viciae]TCA00194.1 calcium-binding protein [Rhizobium leguminosarum bv. viciae]
MVSVSSSAASGNSTALTLLKGSAQSAAASTKQSAASQILSSISGVNLDPLKQAEGQITRILLESGGQFIIGGAFSDIIGTDKDDVIRAGPSGGVNGGAGDDIISGSFLMDISGGTGNDQISVSTDSTIDGGGGNDAISVGNRNTVAGGAGDDTISAAFENTVIGGVGNDTIGAAHRNSLDAGAGDDTISAGIGNTITGGTGNDKIAISGLQAESYGNGSSGSTVKFEVGDGQDSINLIQSSSTVELGEGFTAENTKVTITGNKATISFNGNENDGISVDFFFGSALTLSFADGNTLEVKPGETPMPSFVSSYGQV